MTSSDDPASAVRLFWADDHPEALQELVDPTITLAGGDALRGWELPAGWVPIVNRLHADLVDLIGDYLVVRVGNKMAAVRYAINWPDDMDPNVHQAVSDLLMAAKTESLATCDLCGRPANGRLSFGVTRCEAHQFIREHPIPGARARSPGWRPEKDDRPSASGA